MDREPSHGLGSKSSDTENNIPYFSKARTLFVQTKLDTPTGRLTIGQAGDKYEREADAVADQVVQRLAVGDSKVAANSDSPALQTKCAACLSAETDVKTGDEKEKINKKEEQEDIQETVAEVQGKDVLESNEENAPADVQAKVDCQVVADTSAEQGVVPVLQTNAFTAAPAVQLQSEPEQQIKLAGEEEMVQMKPIFDSAADPPEEATVQRACAACEQEEQKNRTRCPAKIG